MQRRAMVRWLVGMASALALPPKSRAHTPRTEDQLKGSVRILCSYPAGGLSQELSCSVLNKASVPQIFYDLPQVSQLRPNFRVGTGEVGSAAAALGRGSQSFMHLIIYNPAWMHAMLRQTSTTWVCYSILAHEVSHHLQGHANLTESGQVSSQPSLELEADEFSGFIIARMCGTLSEAQLAVRTFGAASGAGMSPLLHLRLAAIARGWERGQV